MSCRLLDVQCHALSWLASLPWYVYALAALAVVLLGWVLYDKIKGAALRIIRWGGWRAGVAALLGVIAILAAVWPRKSAHEQYPHSDGEPAHPRPRKKRPTIFDGFRK